MWVHQVVAFVRLHARPEASVIGAPTRPSIRDDVASARDGAGVTGAELTDGRLIPMAFRAMTLITYAVPFVRPVTVRDGTIDTGWIKLVHDPATPLLLEYFTI